MPGFKDLLPQLPWEGPPIPRGLVKSSLYRVTRTIHLTHLIEASSAKEAERIAEDKGDIDARAYATNWRARRI